MSYEKPPEPGTYYIKSVAAPKNVVEILNYNQERAVCSPRRAESNSNQQWYIQHSGRGYKIKNVKYGLYLTPHSTQPAYGTDRLLARKAQKEQELQDALERLSHSGTLPKVIQIQLAEVREKIEGLECLVESYSNRPEPPNNTS
ncbi:hypothetical protein RSAG8_00758, partial [Rhizoctonia solani AG-8 WAC10335]